MEQYIAFLRGINVSGQKKMKMELLREAFTQAGFSDIKTYIQSGNVLFNSEISDAEKLVIAIENLIQNAFGFQCEVILRRMSDIKSLVSSPLFKKVKSEIDSKYYITFLRDRYIGNINLPLFSKNRDVEIIFSNELYFISLSTIYKGNYGFPNAFIEKFTGIPATTRNPNTLEKLLTI